MMLVLQWHWQSQHGLNKTGVWSHKTYLCGPWSWTSGSTCRPLGLKHWCQKSCLHNSFKESSGTLFASGREGFCHRKESSSAQRQGPHINLSNVELPPPPSIATATFFSSNLLNLRLKLGWSQPQQYWHQADCSLVVYWGGCGWTFVD